MAIAIDKTNLGSNSGAGVTTLTITTTAATAANARIIVFISGGQTVSSVTDSNSNTYAQDRAEGTSVAVWSAHSASVLASGATITVTFSASSNPAFAWASSFTGIPSTAAVDQANSRISFNEQTWTTGSITPTVSPSVVVGFYHSGGAPAATSTPGAGWTELFDSTVGVNNRTAVYQIVSDLTARNPTGDFSAGQGGAEGFGATVNYKEGASGEFFTRSVEITFV